MQGEMPLDLFRFCVSGFGRAMMTTSPTVTNIPRAGVILARLSIPCEITPHHTIVQKER